MLPGITPALMSAASPGNDSFTVLLVHFDGPNSSTVMPDSSPKQHGNAAVAGGCYLTAGSPLTGGGACLLNPASGYITFPNSADWEFGAGDFTVDWWEYRNVAAGCAVARDLATTYCPFLLHFGANGEIYMTSNGSAWDIANGAAGLPSPSFGPATLSVWNHFAVTRQGSTFRAFKNGVQKSTWTSALAIKSNANPLCIGAAQNGQNANTYTEELRISKGIARWTAPFTPPTKPYGPDYVPPPPPSAANFLVTAPASVSLNTPFNVTVQARDGSNANTTNYSGTVHFTSTDGAAVLPANSTLTNGVGTFSVTLKTAGSFTVTATDTVTGSITGTSAAIAVSASSPGSVTLTSGSSWTVPSNFNSAANTIECYGGGGGAAGGDGFNTENDGGGGGGGGYAKIANLALTPGANVSYAIGGGGAGLAAYTAATAGAGGDTWFSATTTVRAQGGGGGVNASVDGNGNGGRGGGTSSVGTTKFIGGNGENGNVSGGSGTGGGGCAGPSSNGGSGIGTQGGASGGGLAGAGANNQANGSPYGGGGGGGGYNGGNGGNGAPGVIKITWS